MESICLMVNETVKSFSSSFNLGSEQSKDILLQCRPTVEKYYFSKLYDKLFAMYAIKHQEAD